MDYAKHYRLLMERARSRTLDGYSERHHVVPKCLGGTNKKSNIVRLTPEEHYVAHQLLVKIHPGDHRLLWAAVMMSGGNTKQTRRSGNKLRGWLRRRFADEMGRRQKGRRWTEEERRRHSKALKGRKMPPFTYEHRAKLSAAAKGKRKSLEHCTAISVAKKGIPGRKHTEATRALLSEVVRAAVRNSEKYQASVAYRSTSEYRSEQSKRMTAWWQKRKSATAERAASETGV